MDRDELLEQIKPVLDSGIAISITDQLDALMRLLDNYVASIKPAKEVIPRAWAKYIEYERDGDENDDVIIWYANNSLDFNDDKKAYAKFIRAIANGYEVEPEKKYYVLAPKVWWVDSYTKLFFAKRFELPGIGMARKPIGRNEYYEFTMDEIKEYKLDNFERVPVEVEE